ALRMVLLLLSSFERLGSDMQGASRSSPDPKRRPAQEILESDFAFSRPVSGTQNRGDHAPEHDHGRAQEADQAEQVKSAHEVWPDTECAQGERDECRQQAAAVDQ